MSTLYQVAALPIRKRRSRATEVLLVTSRETRRWVVPKGWRWREVTDHDAAAGEAWEEAGVRGIVSPDCFGTFTYKKRRKGKIDVVKVLVFILEVTEEAKTWPEVAERERAWYSAAKAAELVEERGLKVLLKRLAA